MTLPEILQNRWQFVVIIGLIFFVGVLFAGINLTGKESFATLYLDRINNSAIPSGEKIIVTNETDFRDLPKLGSIILNTDENSTESYTVLFSEEEYLIFVARFWSNQTAEEGEQKFPPRRVIEYKGKYFEYYYPEIH